MIQRTAVADTPVCERIRVPIDETCVPCCRLTTNILSVVTPITTTGIRDAPTHCIKIHNNTEKKYFHFFQQCFALGTLRCSVFNRTCVPLYYYNTNMEGLLFAKLYLVIPLSLYQCLQFEHFHCATSFKTNFIYIDHLKRAELTAVSLDIQRSCVLHRNLHVTSS